MRKIEAFTLIELLVVIAIIGILSTVVLVNLSGTRQRARDARRKSDLANIRLAIEMYYDAQNPPAYPTGITDALLGIYMSGSKVPTDPRGGATKPYCYSLVSGAYNVCAKLESPSGVTCLPDVGTTIPATCVDGTFSYY